MFRPEVTLTNAVLRTASTYFDYSPYCVRNSGTSCTTCRWRTSVKTPIVFSGEHNPLHLYNCFFPSVLLLVITCGIALFYYINEYQTGQLITNRFSCPLHKFWNFSAWFPYSKSVRYANVLKPGVPFVYLHAPILLTEISPGCPKCSQMNVEHCRQLWLSSARNPQSRESASIGQWGGELIAFCYKVPYLLIEWQVATKL